MSTPTPNLQLTKPDELEQFNVSALNRNFDTIDAAMPNIITNKPANKQTKIFYGRVVLTTGAGGEDPNAGYATTVAGIGGVWLGKNGVPTFEGVTYARLDDSGNDTPYSASFVILDANATRIKFRGVKQEGGFTASYANVNLFVQIVGW